LDIILTSKNEILTGFLHERGIGSINASEVRIY
jgi:hypothetical protein